MDILAGWKISVRKHSKLNDKMHVLHTPAGAMILLPYGNEEEHNECMVREG